MQREFRTKAIRSISPDIPLKRRPEGWMLGGHQGIELFNSVQASCSACIPTIYLLYYIYKLAVCNAFEWSSIASLSRPHKMSALFYHASTWNVCFYVSIILLHFTNTNTHTHTHNLRVEGYAFIHDLPTLFDSCSTLYYRKFWQRCGACSSGGLPRIRCYSSRSNSPMKLFRET